VGENHYSTNWCSSQCYTDWLVIFLSNKRTQRVTKLDVKNREWKLKDKFCLQHVTLIFSTPAMSSSRWKRIWWIPIHFTVKLNWSNYILSSTLWLCDSTGVVLERDCESGINVYSAIGCRYSTNGATHVRQQTFFNSLLHRPFLLQLAKTWYSGHPCQITAHIIICRLSSKWSQRSPYVSKTSGKCGFLGQTQEGKTPPCTTMDRWEREQETSLWSRQ